MTVLYVPRSAWFAGKPTNNNGTARALLRTPVPTITRHYTGAPPSARAYTWPAADFMPWFQQIARNRQPNPASYEYNYVIPPRADGSAQVWEYAGAYQAAHSQGENDRAIGVLFAIGVSNHPSYDNYDRTRPTVWEDLTDAMVDAYRWLRDVHLVGAGLIRPGVDELEHFLMPGAATACPGESVIRRGADLDAPYTPDGEPMEVQYFKLSKTEPTVWATSDGLTAVRLDAATAEARGVDVFKVPVIDQAEGSELTYLPGLPYASVR